MSNSEALATLGVPGLVAVIVVLAGVIVFLYRQLTAKDKMIYDIQGARLADAKETRDKISESMQAQATLTKQIYDIVITNTGRQK